jgi:hypothetical protein
VLEGTAGGAPKTCWKEEVEGILGDEGGRSFLPSAGGGVHSGQGRGRPLCQAR